MKTYDENVLCELYVKHKKLRIAAEIAGCSDETVRRALIRNGIPRIEHKYKKAVRKNTADEKEIRDILAAYYETDKTINDLSREFQRAQKTISDILKKYGCGIKHNPINAIKITDKQILSEIESGLTRQEIADKYNVHVENLARRMRRLGVHAVYTEHIQSHRKIFGECWHYIESQAEAFSTLYPGLQYLETRRFNGNCRIRFKCKTCGNVIDRSESAARAKRVACEYCDSKKKEFDQLQDGRVKLIRFFIALEEARKPKKCACCGNVFFSQYHLAAYCSERCKRKAKKERRKERDPIGYRNLRKDRTYQKRHVSRAKKYGTQYEYGITLIKVINKNKNVCQICGGICDKNDRTWGAFGPFYPSIDHIVPLSKGGSHRWDNVQLAHMICNSYKRDITTV